MIAALYARVSTRDRGQAVENQLAQLRDFCQHQGWTIAREFIDRVSAKTVDRPQFKALFAAASRREFDLVLLSLSVLGGAAHSRSITSACVDMSAT